MPAHAAALFRWVPPLGRPPSALSFNAMLTAFSLAGDTESLANAFREFTASQDPPIARNTISYDILILALCEKSQFDAALDALNLMQMDYKERKIEPNLVTFNTILNAFYQNDRFDDAEKVCARMVERRIDPDIWSFNLKLRGLVAEKRVPEGVEIVEQLKSVGPRLDTYTYNALIKGYCLDGNLEEAKRIYKDLGKNGCVPNRWTFEILASEFCKVGELDAALKLCRHSICQRCCVGVGVLQEVVDMLARNSRFEEAKRLVERAKLKSYTRNRLRMPLPCLAL